jgi:hypothetical protein
MFGAQFYHSLTRKYIAVFGSLFNDITITRLDNNGVEQQRIKVPIAYGPSQKWLARINQDPSFDKPQVILPRMSFEIQSMQYAGDRKLTANKRIYGSGADSRNSVWMPSPYDLTVDMTIFTKYAEDGTKILEQILPYFRPDFTPSVELMSDPEIIQDIPIILNSVASEDVYEGNFEERRALTWTLNFTIKGWYYGPVSTRKIIKFIDINLYTSLDSANNDVSINIQPGLTANGEPTTILADSIPYANVEYDDDWAYIVQIIDET